jgi:hypothetical protein
MSFSLTEEQLMNGTKSVTRRTGWMNLKPGDRLRAVRKAMGLKKGERVHQLCEIEIVQVYRELLCHISELDVIREGFKGWTREQFIDMFMRTHKIKDPATIVTRIEFFVIPGSERIDG